LYEPGYGPWGGGGGHRPKEPPMKFFGLPGIESGKGAAVFVKSWFRIVHAGVNCIKLAQDCIELI
jgi:hypothetical protein